MNLGCLVIFVDPRLAFLVEPEMVISAGREQLAKEPMEIK